MSETRKRAKYTLEFKMDAVRLIWRTHSYAAASLSHRFGKTQSPARSRVDALIDVVVGAACAARSQSGSKCPPSFDCAPQSSHSGGPRAGDMCDGCESTPMCSRIRLICVPSVMNAIRRICPPHSGHSSRDQENNSSLPSKDMRPSCAPKAGNFSLSWRRNSISDCLWVSVSTAGVATMASP
jgi:hypothetical protein